jgi:hypothetical protein
MILFQSIYVFMTSRTLEGSGGILLLLEKPFCKVSTEA